VRPPSPHPSSYSGGEPWRYSFHIIIDMIYLLIVELGTEGGAEGEEQDHGAGRPPQPLFKFQSYLISSFISFFISF